MTDSFVFYRSFHECLEHVDDASYRRIMNAIMGYALNAAKPELQGLEMAVFIAIKPQIDANTKRRENGRLGGRPVQGRTETPPDIINIEGSGTNLSEYPGTVPNQSGAAPNQNKPGHNQEEPNHNQSEPNVNANGNVNVNVNDNAHTLSQNQFARFIYDAWIREDMPLSGASKKNYNVFLSSEMEGRASCFSAYQKQPDKILNAVKNAAALNQLINSAQSWRDMPVSFKSFCGHLDDYLPDKFNLDAYRKNKTPAAPPPPVPRKKRICPACSNEIRSNSNICEHCCFDTAGADDPKGHYQHYQQLQTEPSHEDILLVRQILHNLTCRETPVLQG